jgi:hypothetical protein
MLPPLLPQASDIADVHNLFSASDGASASEKAVLIVISRVDELEARNVKFCLSFRHHRNMCSCEHGCHIVSSNYLNYTVSMRPGECMQGLPHAPYATCSIRLMCCILPSLHTTCIYSSSIVSMLTLTCLASIWHEKHADLLLMFNTLARF